MTSRYTTSADQTKSGDPAKGAARGRDEAVRRRPRHKPGVCLRLCIQNLTMLPKYSAGRMMEFDGERFLIG